MSADICSDVGQQIKNEAKESSENLEKVHLSTSNENNWHLVFIPRQMTTTACRFGTRFHSLSVCPPLPGDGIPSIAPIEGVDLDSLSDMSETDRAKAMFNQLKQVKAGPGFE